MRIGKMTMAAALLGIAVAIGGPANANVITQSRTTSGSAAMFGIFGGAFDQFDPSLGTLNSVGVQFAGDITYFVSFTKLQPDCIFLPCGASFGFSTGFYFNAPGFPITHNNTADFFEIVNWSGGTIDPNLSPQTSPQFPIDSALLFADPNFLASYIGGGTVGILGEISKDSDYCNPGIVIVCNMSNTFNLTSTLTYDFTPIPEPVTLSIFGTGVALSLVLRRRRKAEQISQ